MKCIKYNIDNKIARLPNEIAEQDVACGIAKYVSKTEWKQKVRDAKK